MSFEKHLSMKIKIKVDTLAILEHATINVPSFFSSTKNYHSRYVKCQRLLREMAKELHDFELSLVSDVLLSLHKSNQPKQNEVKVITDGNTIITRAKSHQ